MILLFLAIVLIVVMAIISRPVAKTVVHGPIDESYIQLFLFYKKASEAQRTVVLSEPIKAFFQCIVEKYPSFDPYVDRKVLHEALEFLKYQNVANLSAFTFVDETDGFKIDWWKVGIKWNCNVILNYKPDEDKSR